MSPFIRRNTPQQPDAEPERDLLFWAGLSMQTEVPRRTGSPVLDAHNDAIANVQSYLNGKAVAAQTDDMKEYLLRLRADLNWLHIQPEPAPVETDAVSTDPAGLSASEVDALRALAEALLGSCPALNLHLFSAHCNSAALGLSEDEALDQHDHEHHGPGGIRNHPFEDYFYDTDKVVDSLMDDVIEYGSFAEATTELLALMGIARRSSV